jgi:hypothetical protein
MLKDSREGGNMTVSPQNPGDKMYSVLGGSCPVGSINYFYKVRVGCNAEFQAVDTLGIALYVVL